MAVVMGSMIECIGNKEVGKTKFPKTCGADRFMIRVKELSHCQWYESRAKRTSNRVRSY